MKHKNVDNAIVQRAAEGERDVFKHIYNVYNEKIYNLAYYMLGCENEARDVTQEIFIKLFTSLHQFKYESEFSTWFYRLSINTCLDYIRREKRRTTGNTRNIEMDSIADTVTEPVDSLVMRKQITKDIEDAIQSLSPKIRSVMVLRLIDGFSYEEISRILNCSVGTVSSRLNRGYKTLGKALFHLREEE